MSFIKHPLRPSDITQDDPLYYIYETTQSMAISFDVVNNAGAILVNSSDPNYYDNFNITIDQLEGEINVPYQYVDRLVDNDDGSQVVERRIDVPNSLLGGFAQWRVNYTFIEFPDAPSYGEGDNQGTFVSGDFNTPRIVVPRYIAPPVVIEPDGFFLNPDDIKEALADKIYDTFFKSDVLETIPLGDVKKLQTTIYQGSLATGRPDDNSPLVFFKKDRNTPENKRDFGSDSIQAIVTDISASLSSVDALGDVNITSFLDNELTVLDPKKSDELLPSSEIQEGTEDTPEYFYQITTIELQYKDLEPIPFASFRTLYNTNEAVEENRYVDEFGNVVPIQWENVLNLSQLTSPITGNRIDKTKAREVLDSEVFELLPPRVTRQDQIDKFFQDFQNLIGGQPSFEDVDDDGAGEQLTSDPASRISQNPNDPSAMITRTDGDANSVNEGKTLESMRNTLNTYLGDVDNVVEEPFDERPEYVNKSTGFLKLRKLNQAIIIRSNTDINLLEKESTGKVAQNAHRTSLLDRTGPSWMVDGFTITMWVRFTDSTTDGTLFTYGNPFLLNEPAFRLETLVRQPGDVYLISTTSGDTTYPEQTFIKPYRIARLVVWDTNHSAQEPKLYESSFPRNYTRGYVSNDPVDGGIGRYSSGGPRVFKSDTSGRASYGRGVNDVFGRTALEQYPDNRAFCNYTHIPTDDLNEWFFICATYNPQIREDYSTYSDTEDTIYNKVVPHTNVNYPVADNNTSGLATRQVTHFWLNQLDFDPNIVYPNTGITVGQSNFGNRCKVEVISRSDLLRARGFKVDE